MLNKYKKYGMTLLGIILFYLILCWNLGEKYQATYEAHTHRIPDEVWTILTDYINYPVWWSRIIHIQVIEANSDQEVTLVKYEQGHSMYYQTTQKKRPKLLVHEVYDSKNELPFSGNWQIELIDKNNSTLIRVTENGLIKKFWFRPVILLIDKQARIKSFADSLASYLK